jgi:hypothetical protein
MTMTAETNLIDELEDVLASKFVARRAEILRKVTDLFVLGSGQFSEDQIELFDNVMGRLLGHIEFAARAQFGSRIARLADAPPKVVRVLANDDAIEVAGPLLTHCERLDEATLIESARTKSQDHLLAISTRKVLVEAVTDVLARPMTGSAKRSRSKPNRVPDGFASEFTLLAMMAAEKSWGELGTARRNWSRFTSFHFTCRTASAGLVAPSSPVSTRIVSSALCGPR